MNFHTWEWNTFLNDVIPSVATLLTFVLLFYVIRKLKG